jgi:hypothetical protein
VLHGSVGNFGGVVGLRLPGQGVLHPLNIISIGEVISSVSSTGLFSVLGGIDGHLTLDEQILKLKSLYEIGVPDISSIAELKVLVHLGDLMYFIAALLEQILSSEDGSVSLHCLLELASDLGWGMLTI